MQPLFLQSVMHEKVWGGDKLKRDFGYAIPSSKTGEYWAISAHPKGPSTISQGDYKGFTLDVLYRERPDLFGYPHEATFPLLVKLLDASDWLSVQVHPDDTYAKIHEGELGKTECWYILSAEKGAEIIYGHTATSQAELESLIATGAWDKLLTRVKVKAGDFFYVPSGTLHAIGKGIVLLEIQQSSDTTYRVYDFDRLDASGQKRDLHLQQSLAVTTIGKPANSHPATIAMGNLEVTVFVSTTFFTVVKWVIKGQVSFRQTTPYSLVSILSGQGKLSVGDEDYQIKKGDHFILTNTIKSWEIDGDLEAIVSHP